jgi:DDE superfamily endonuclease
MAAALMLAAAICRMKEEEEESRQRFDFNNLPALLVESLNKKINDTVYDEATRVYNEEQLQQATNFVAAVPPRSLGHSDIDCITSENAYPSLCGFTFQEFDRLFHSLRRPLEHLFPRSPSYLPVSRNHSHQFSSRRMKLFLFLFRCKLGASFKQMEGIFGWSSAAICRWFEAMIFTIPVAMQRYNKDFLRFKGQNWQRKAATEWSQQRLAENSFHLYLDRIRSQNARHGVATNEVNTIDENIIGSLGAADGTISVCPQISQTVLVSQGEEPGSDRMYCQYKKTHGWKLLAFISHAKGPTGKKYILKVKSSVGSTFDGTLYAAMIPDIMEDLIPGIFFLGDHAFHRQLLALCPYTATECAASIMEGPGMNRYNQNHSSSRMCSEHGMRYLKSWGIIRGRSDHWLFSTSEMFESALDTVWALHNYQADGCPLVSF